MLAETTINNTEVSVYTVPSGKQAYIYLDVYSSLGSGFTVKINNREYFSEVTAVFTRFRLCLTAGDVVRVGTSGTVNVFVHGSVI